MHNLQDKIQAYSKNISILLVDDDEIVLDMYYESLKEYIPKIELARDGLEAYQKIIASKEGFDVIITDIMMPNMNGFELIKKVKNLFYDQRFIVLSSLKNLNEMHEIINLGVDGILQKPYDKQSFFHIFYRVAKSIFNEKILKTRAKQLLMLTRDKIILKKKTKKISADQETIARIPKIKKTKIAPLKNSKKLEKYDTRASITGVSADELLLEIDIVNVDKIDLFQDKLMDYEVLLCATSKVTDTQQIKQNFKLVSVGLQEFVDSINIMGRFPVAVNAAKHLISFLSDLDANEFTEEEKKDLAIDALLYILQDINDWIIAVFVKQIAQNINYFDASFANSCMEFEMLFIYDNNDIENDDDLEFF